MKAVWHAFDYSIFSFFFNCREGGIRYFGCWQIRLSSKGSYLSPSPAALGLYSPEVLPEGSLLPAWEAGLIPLPWLLSSASCVSLHSWNSETKSRSDNFAAKQTCAFGNTCSFSHGQFCMRSRLYLTISQALVHLLGSTMHLSKKKCIFTSTYNVCNFTSAYNVCYYLETFVHA